MRFAMADLTEGGALSARGLRARLQARRRDRDAQEGLAALGRIQRDTEGSDRVDDQPVGEPRTGEQPDDDTFAA
jgi:hypothetical protein